MIANSFLVYAVLFGELSEREICQELSAKYNAEVEVVLSDGTRCDLLSDTLAIEVERTPAWAEAIGQSLHYAELSGRKPGIILLLSDPTTEWRHLVRCARLCGKLGITLYVEEIN